MIEQYALYLAAAYCFGAFIYWYTHRKPKEVEKKFTKDEAIKATAQYYKDLDIKKGYIHAFERVRTNPYREIPRPEIEKLANLKRKALKEVR